ncbi:MAG: GTPase HflX [Lentisphaeria bacterium]|nr:GTPase HflX [Lentisphaeria bacterium]
MPRTDADEAREMLRELHELTNTLGIPIVGSTMVKVRKPQARYLVGGGTAESVVEQANECDADVIIFDDPLLPSQQRNWEELSELAVIDRQEVILDIFAGRAQTREARLQVQLARAFYSLPRLKRKWTHLHRQRGATGGMGMRGEGEQQLEVDSRLVRTRIAKLKEQLKEVRQHRHTQRSQRMRKPVPVAAIVGYTNAGKSTLLNTMTDAGVFVEDKLFATLDPTVRRVTLPNRQELLLADTVGFIRKLPHSLVEAFKSTLEETFMADFLVEVVDATTDQLEERLETTRDVLTELGASEKRMITVFNKVDLVKDELTLRRLARKYDDAIFVSAKTGQGIEEFRDRLALELSHGLERKHLRIPHSRHDLVARLHRSCAVLEQRHEDDAVYLTADIPKQMLSELAAFFLDSKENC